MGIFDDNEIDLSKVRASKIYVFHSGAPDGELVYDSEQGGVVGEERPDVDYDKPLSESLKEAMGDSS